MNARRLTVSRHYPESHASRSGPLSPMPFLRLQGRWLDEAGYLYLTDRDGDLIISGGVNIYPREAENVLLDHPAVDDVAIVGVHDDDLGQRAVAVVVPSEGQTGDPALAEALLAYCRERLARFKCPRELRFQAELPRSEAGKVVKREIRRMLEEPQP